MIDLLHLHLLFTTFSTVELSIQFTNVYLKGGSLQVEISMFTGIFHPHILEVCFSVTAKDKHHLNHIETKH